MSGNYYRAGNMPQSDSEVALSPMGSYGGQNSRYTPVVSGAYRSPKKQGLFAGKKKWIAIGLVAICVIVGAVVGGVVGSDNGNSKKSNTASDAVANGVLSTDARGNEVYSLNANSDPIYPTASASATGVSPSIKSDSTLSCGNDTFTASSSNDSTWDVRSDHPRLFAPSYKWNCLPTLIQNDAYMSYWNATIFTNASRYYDMDPQPYTTDGGLSGSGVLDPAREIQLRIKHWAYAWRMSNDTKWADRAWTELLTASNNNSAISFGTAPDIWNAQGHFLDAGEFTLAFAYAYDWMYDAWNTTQRDAIMWSIINLGLKYGLNTYTNSTAKGNYGWWQSTNGNWNCVCNGGLTLGALAIANEDPTGTAKELLSYTVDNAKANCYQAVQEDGTWSETSDYWYFGSTAAAQMWSGVLTATGYDHGIKDANANYNKTGLFHMYGTGFVQKFNYGDCGPNKYTATANSLMFVGDQFDIPTYTLYQRERSDAPEPLSMFWYNPEVSGDWWDGLALDHSFENPDDTWVSMRASWTDPTQLYTAMKSGNLTGHQTHGDLDIGDFVFEALGQRWAGELCQAQYLGDGYFSSEGQDAERWTYYRKRTEGQNTLLIDYQNQDVTALPPTPAYGSTGESQNMLAYTAPNASTAYWVSDISSAYFNATSVKRGMRLLNGRRQMLIQDEITGADGDIMWRMHTNATIAYSNNNQTATLSLGGETTIVELLSPSNGAFTTMQPVRFATDPTLPTDTISQDLPNGNVSVLTMSLSGGGTTTIQVLFSPQWPGLSSSDYVTPPNVTLSSWSLTSHN